MPRSCHQERPQFDPAVAGLRAVGGHPERGVEVRRLDDPEADEVLLRLDVRPVGEHRLPPPGGPPAPPPRAPPPVADPGDARPPAKTQLPSAWSFSLKTSIAAASAGLAMTGPF